MSAGIISLPALIFALFIRDYQLFTVEQCIVNIYPPFFVCLYMFGGLQYFENANLNFFYAGILENNNKYKKDIYYVQYFNICVNIDRHGSEKHPHAVFAMQLKLSLTIYTSRYKKRVVYHPTVSPTSRKGQQYVIIRAGA